MKNLVILLIFLPPFNLAKTTTGQCPQPWSEKWIFDFSRYLKAVFEQQPNGTDPGSLEPCQPGMTNLTCTPRGTANNRCGTLKNSTLKLN